MHMSVRDGADRKGFLYRLSRTAVKAVWKAVACAWATVNVGTFCTTAMPVAVAVVDDGLLTVMPG